MLDKLAQGSCWIHVTDKVGVFASFVHVFHQAIKAKKATEKGLFARHSPIEVEFTMLAKELPLRMRQLAKDFSISNPKYLQHCFTTCNYHQIRSGWRVSYH